MTSLDRYRGAILGLAAGDALGTTIEFTTPGNFTPVTDITGGGPFNLKAGEWTDDTSMMLCLAESLLECGAFDPIDQLRLYVKWKRTGHNSSNGQCFDIGGTVMKALARFERLSERTPGAPMPTPPVTAR
jgi:ADP-ribosylglycohydrolase